MLPGLLPQLQVRVGVAPGEEEQAERWLVISANIFTLIAQRKQDLYSLQDAHLKLQPVEDFYQVVHISQELMGSGDLLCILVRVILLQERQAIHVTVAQPLAVIPVAQTLPLTWERKKWTYLLTNANTRPGIVGVNYRFPSPGGSLQM